MQSRADPHCTLCGYVFSDELRATGEDRTPFAHAFAEGERGWRRMCEWVWFANHGRLKHLALMRSSAASRRFALTNMILLSAVLGVFQGALSGWHPVTHVATIDDDEHKPAGDGWLHISTGQVRDAVEPGTTATLLWWNPPQTIIAAVSGGVAGLLLMQLAMMLGRGGLALMHRAPYRAEGRMTAALDYSTAWFAPVLFSGVLVASLPLAYIGRTKRWVWTPPPEVLAIAAGTLAALGAILWWFWMIRVSATAPARTRGRVLCFAALGLPLIVAGAGAGWWTGLAALLEIVFKALNLEFYS